MPGLFVKVCKVDLSCFYCWWVNGIKLFHMSRFRAVIKTLVPCKPRLCFEVNFYLIFPRVQGWTHHCRRRSWWENIGMACCYGLVSHRLLADFMGLEKAGFAAVEVTIIPT